ncbi:MAG: hypothetical protein M3198_04760 [Actinomycetota bacterium]|nr:hypothetical protein [Actinomycetota bacterium]
MRIDLPVACSLDAPASKSREQEWESLISSHLVDRGAIVDGVKLTFRSSEVSRTEVKRLVDLERDCCAWINWDLREADTSLALEATAETEEGVKVLRSWFTPEPRPS